MSSIVARSLEYQLLPGQPVPGLNDLALRNATYTFWKDFWDRVLAKNGTEARVHADDFARQSILSVLTHENAPVGFFSSTVFDLQFRAHREHSYFSRAFSEKFFRQIQERGVKRVMTIEWYAVRNDWREKEKNLSLAMIMAGLAVKISQQIRTDAIVCVARTDIGVDRFGKAFGAEVLDGPIDLFNTPCALLAFYADRVHPHADYAVQEIVDDLWKRRRDSATAVPDFGKQAA